MKSTFRSQLADDLHAASARWGDAIERHGTPVLLFDPGELRRSYCALSSALPRVDWHYAVKAQPHPEVVACLAEVGAYFDVASMNELHTVLGSGVHAARCLHSNPHRKRAEIVAAHRAGVRRFVVDSRSEVDKFVGIGASVELLVRVSTPNRHANIDLSRKFGAAPEEVELIVKHALAQGIPVVGLSVHTGSQNESPHSYAEAVRLCLTIIDTVSEAIGVTMTVLDFGGGFPVPYLDEVPVVEEFAAAIDDAMGDRWQNLTVLAEPGRIVVASSMTLVSSVVGISQRDGVPWIHLDDGLYGSYSNVLTEHITPPILSGSEVFARDGVADRLMVPTTIAGPTCDSLDVIAVGHPMPAMSVGDLVISPMMGAYTSATATDFNGMPRTPVVRIS